MSRNYKNIGNFDVIAFANSDNSFVGELKAGETAVYDVAVSFAVAVSVSRQYSNFYINYTTGTAFTDTTSVNCPLYGEIVTYNGVQYQRMIQYFGATSSNNYVTIEPKYISGGNVELKSDVTGISLDIDPNNTRWYITSYPVTTTTATSLTYVVRATPETGYAFSNSVYTLTVVFSNDESTYNKTGNSTDSIITFDVNISTSDSTVSCTLTGTATDNHITVTFNVPNGVGTVSPENPVIGDVLTFTIKANDSYVITQAYYTISGAFGTENVNYTISDDKKTATATYDSSENPTIRQVSNFGITELSENVPTVSIKFINANVLTGENLIELSKKRWYIADSNYPQNIVDLAYYISSLKKFYCNIPTSTTGNIYLAWYDTGIEAGVVASDIITIDCGSVDVERPNNNINDYTNTQIQILVPFIGIQTLDPDLIIGKSVHLYYKVSTITGDCVAFIAVNDVIYYEYTGSMCEDIPYVLNNIAWQLKGSVDFNSSVLYGFIPVLTVMFHSNYNDNETILLTDEKYTKLSDVTGLNYIDDVVIDDMSIPDDVRILIQSELANGVIF